MRNLSPMRLVELADEFHLTTAEAVDLCLAAGIAATSSEDELTADEVARWRRLAEDQRAWQNAAREEAARTQEREMAEASARLASARTSFGPIPPAPWEQERSHDDPPVAGAPAASATPAELGEGWAPSSVGVGGPQVSLYAAAALALAVVSLIFPFVPALLAVPLAWYAKTQIAKSRGALTGERFASAAIVVSLIGMVLWVGIFAVALYNDNQNREARLTSPDVQVNLERLEWNDLHAGPPQPPVAKPGEVTPTTRVEDKDRWRVQCIRIPHADLPQDGWQRVSCDAPHEAELFYVELILRGDANYPGMGQIVPGAKTTCARRFEEYVGRPFASSDLKMAVIFPSLRNWTEENDRSIACVAYQDQYALLNGTLQGSNR